MIFNKTVLQDETSNLIKIFNLQLSLEPCHGS